MNRLLRENWMTMLVVVLMVTGYVLLHTRGDDLPSTTEFDTRITDGTPLIVEFYSNT